MVGVDWTAIAIFVSAVLAITGVHLSNRQAQIASRRTHTYQVHASYINADWYTDVLSHVRNLRQQATIPHPDEKGREADTAKIDRLLNHYEFISATILNGDLDEGFIRILEQSRIIELFQDLRGYIQQDLASTKQWGMYANLETLYRRWIGAESQGKFNSTIEFFTLRPHLEKRAKARLLKGLDSYSGTASELIRSKKGLRAAENSS